MFPEPAANSVATFLRLSRPISFSPLHVSAAVPNIQLGPALANRNVQRVAFSAGFIGTGLALSALYTGIFKGGRDVRNANDTFTPVQWLGEIHLSTLLLDIRSLHCHAEYPAGYVSPIMDLFAEDQVPLGVSSPLSCPQDSEHLERAFDLLQYQHLFKKLGVSSVVDHHILIARVLRILGNTSSGSSVDLLSAPKLLSSLDASSTQGGPQQTDSDSSDGKGGEKNSMYPVRRC
jgi:hypothetical protein